MRNSHGVYSCLACQALLPLMASPPLRVQAVHEGAGTALANCLDKRGACCMRVGMCFSCVLAVLRHVFVSAVLARVGLCALQPYIASHCMERCGTLA